jgi:hypothetical protein
VLLYEQVMVFSFHRNLDGADAIRCFMMSNWRKLFYALFMLCSINMEKACYPLYVLCKLSCSKPDWFPCTFKLGKSDPLQLTSQLWLWNCLLLKPVNHGSNP